MSVHSAPNLAHIHHGEKLSEAREEINCQLLSNLGRCTGSGLNVFLALEERQWYVIFGRFVVNSLSQKIRKHHQW